MNLEDLVREAAASASENQSLTSDQIEARREARLADLKEAYASFSLPTTAFKVGDIVDWKPMLGNRSPDGPFVVLELTPGQVDEDAPASSPYFRERLDISVGYMSQTGPNEFTMASMSTDARRLKKL